MYFQAYPYFYAFILNILYSGSISYAIYHVSKLVDAQQVRVEAPASLGVVSFNQIDVVAEDHFPAR